MREEECTECTLFQLVAKKNIIPLSTSMFEFDGPVSSYVPRALTTEAKTREEMTS